MKIIYSFYYISLLLFLFSEALLSQNYIFNPLKSNTSIYSEKYDSQDSTSKDVQVVEIKTVSKSLIIFEELAIGTVIGILTIPWSAIIIGGIVALSVAVDEDEAFIGAAWGGYIGYTLGMSYGVHIVSKKYKQTNSFFGTILSGFIGAASGVAIFFAVDEKSALKIMPVLTPAIGSILYVNLTNQSENHSNITLGYSNRVISNKVYSYITVQLHF